MGLSHDIISEFVKITNDNKEKQKEGIVYATIVQASDGKYVKIDGSDLLTPTDTTTDIEDGERVTVMIKDHRATVTGNVTAPSASGNRVDKVVETVTEQIGVFETVVADKVSVNELEAYKATIENMVVGKADIEDLEATNAVIENLKVKDAEIENLVADKATIEDLEAVNATIENLKVKDAEIENAVIGNLEATKAEIGILEADFAQIKTLVSGNLTSDNILSFNITADKVTMEDAFIKDAMIDTVNASKINAGKINTNSVSIGSEDGGMLITGATQQFTDKNGNVRIQIGRDTSGDFTFALYGEDGQGQLINQNGITASAIADGLIVNDMVSNDAAISGDKLDISSVVTEINNDNTTTIKSNKIYLDEQNQSLEVAFKSLKTQVDTIKDIDSDLTTITDKIQSNTSKIEANKSSISTLLAEDAAIKKQVTDLEGNVVETTNTLTSKYTSLQQNLDGFKTTVNNTYATKTSVNDVKNNLSSNYSTTSAMNSAIEQKVDEISASVSSTYATKNEVKTIDNNIKANYSTTEQMESAISVAKDEINLGISKVYETKTNVESKISSSASSTLTNAKSYADTKKSEAISTASSDATSKANNALTSAKSYTDTAKNDLNTAIGKKANSTDVYTKTQTYTKTEVDSAIKLSKDAIELGVSQKYETKTNVTSQVSTALTNAKSYADTKKSEAISSANNTLNSTIANYYTKSQTDSAIKVAKDAINLGISQTYETKANVETKVSSTLSSAKSYADAKKTEAINTASTDATNKVNSAKKELNTAIGKKANSVDVYTKSEVYTKTQTDSAIKVAKDAINLGVSQTYETKANVESKINSIQIGGRNLLKGTSSSFKEFTMNEWYCLPYDYLLSDLGLKVGDKVAFKLYLKFGNTLCGGAARITFINTAGKNIKSVNNAVFVKPNSEGYSEITTEIPANAVRIRVGAQRETAGTGLTHFNFQIKEPKLEQGTKCSTWSPAPEDVDSAINKKANAVDVYKKTETYTKTQTDSAIKLAKDSVTTQVGKVEEIASSSLQGKMLYTDPTFTSGVNDMKVYNNSSNGTVTITRITKSSDCPTTSGYMMQIKTTGAASPGHGGFYFGTQTRNNAIFVTKIIAKIPSGYTLNFATNGIGTGGSHKWLTSNSGTGNWKEYIYKVTCGNGGTLSSTNFFHLSGGSTATTSSPVTWYVAMATTFDITATDNIEKRMNSAEQKITDTAITNVVKQNFYTKSETDKQITSKGYQTASQVQQTVNNLQIKFTESGGYNLLRNGKAALNTNFWVSNGGGISRSTDTVYKTCFKTSLPSGIKYNGGDSGSAIRLKNNTHYVYEAMVYSRTAISGTSVTPLHFWCGTTATTGGMSQCTIVDYQQAVPKINTWTKCYVHILTKASGEVWFTPFIYTGGGLTGEIWVTELSLSESSIQMPYSPHPSEVYDGLTQIDKEGITVTASNVRSKTKMSADGFQLIRTTDNKKMFYVNQDGSLEMSGNFTQYDTNGKISIKITNNSYGCYDWLWDGDFVGNFGAFESNRKNTSGANQRFIGISNIADYGNQLVLGVRSSPNSTNFNSYIEIDNTSLMHRDYVTFTANTGFKTNALFRNPNNNNETGRIFGATNNHFFVTCNHNNQLRLGYEKNGSYYAGISIYRNDNTSAGCAIEYHADEVHHNNVVIEGFLSVKGQKNRLVATENFGDRLLNAYETAECYFGDINETIIGEDGEVKVELDEVFLETVNTTEPYQVFLTKYGEGDCYVSERHEKYFIIKGTPSLSVGFEIKAKQRGYEKERLKMTVDTLKSHQTTSLEDEAGYTIDCVTTINRG